VDGKIKEMATIEQILSDEIAKGKSPSVQYYLFDKDNILKEFRTGFAKIDENIIVDSSTTCTLIL
jgi:hypothetical protein